MFYKILGWTSILIAALSLIPSAVPGAMSVMASYIALFMFITSIITIKSGRDFYFNITAILTAIGIFIVNDGLRIYGSLPHTPLGYKLAVYSLFITMFVLVRRYTKNTL